jgi:hypothetical protein
MTGRATKADVHFKSYVDGKLAAEFTEHRAVYPPTAKKLLPTINYMGSLKDVVPQPDGSYLAVLRTRTVRAYDATEVEAMFRRPQQ